eukprot:IDg12764t1
MDRGISTPMLAKYVENPGNSHWNCVKRVIRYLIQTKNFGLCYGGSTASITPHVYVDADWAGDSETRKSMSGFIAIMGESAVSWASRQQEVVALSSTESEYISLCTAVKETVWLRRLVQGLGVLSCEKEPTTIL